MLGLDEELGEGGMRRVGRGRGQDELGVGGDVDLARAPPAVDQRHLPHLAVVLAGDEDVERGGEPPVAADEAGAVLAELHLGMVGALSDRRQARGPDPPALHVAEIGEGAPVVAGRILAPAGHGDVAPAAVAAARAGQHDGVASVRHQMRDRRARHGHDVPADRLDVAACIEGRRLDLLGGRMGGRHIPRHALLEQEFARPDHRLAVEALAHLPAVEHVGDGDDGHALVMGHEAAHDGDGFARGAPRLVEVQRLVEAVAAARAHLQAREVADAPCGSIIAARPVA
jgi:hypothetical protein